MTVVVTGATGGIGAAMVHRFADRGDDVVAVARPTAALDELCAAVPSAAPAPLDLTRPGDLPPALRDLDTVEVLIHAAGIADVAPVTDTPHDLWQRTMATNVTGPAELTRALLPALRAAQGRVVFINAAAGLHGVPRWAAYAASKAALTELADSLRLEEAAHGVRVTSVYPGGVATALLRQVRGAFGRPYEPTACVSPESLAEAVCAIVDAPPDLDVTDISLRPPPR